MHVQRVQLLAWNISHQNHVCLPLKLVGKLSCLLWEEIKLWMWLGKNILLILLLECYCNMFHLWILPPWFSASFRHSDGILASKISNNLLAVCTADETLEITKLIVGFPSIWVPACYNHHCSTCIYFWHGAYISDMVLFLRMILALRRWCRSK